MRCKILKLVGVFQAQCHGRNRVRIYRLWCSKFLVIPNSTSILLPFASYISKFLFRQVGTSKFNFPLRIPLPIYFFTIPHQNSWLNKKDPAFAGPYVYWISIGWSISELSGYIYDRTVITVL